MINRLSISSFFVLSLLLILLTSCSSDKATTSSVIEVPSADGDAIDVLWQNTVTEVLSQDLWSSRDMYDTAHVLMQPMQYAFANNDADKMAEFDLFFDRLDVNFSDAQSTSRVALTQFMFFVSEYLVIKSEQGDFGTVQSSLESKLRNWWVNFVDSEAWMWDVDPFPNVWSRLEWKLDVTEPNYSYYKAMFDEELYSLAMMANFIHLQKAGNLASGQEDFNRLSEQAVPLLKRILQEEVDFTNRYDGTTRFNWSFQTGVWWQHKDFIYAGNAELASDLEPSPIENIALDSAHMHRWPVWLKTYARAFADDAPMLTYLEQLRTGYTQQFNEFVYTKSDNDFKAPRMVNYFDGRNGVYRFQHVTQGESGYGPYQNSSILFYGWYGNLIEADQFVADIERLLENNMRLSDFELATYVGPNTTRERNPLFALPSYFTDGMAELNIRITLAMLKSQ